MKVLILGGDGFCGWPTSLYLSAKGHDVVIVDNFSRRKIDIELGIKSLTPIRPLSLRLQTWKNISGKSIAFHYLDVAQDYAGLLSIIRHYEPDAVIHFAEQRAAPYSMKSPSTRRYTVDNNINATHNLLCAIVESKCDIHFVHLGTMGVYGYGTVGEMPVPEGYLKVRITQQNSPDIEREIMHPADPGSIYHMTKVLDGMLFYFYNKNDRVRVTDLHQGIVWGTTTEDTELDEHLINRFDYDGDYGTVLNRFLVQSAIDHPLTVHGIGGQKRAFIHLRDSVRCIELALHNPPEGLQRVQIFNQMTETYRLIDLAHKVSALTGAKIELVDNPRVEAPTNELIVQNDGFLKIGLAPIKLDDGLMLEVTNIARKYRHRIDRTKIPATSRWR